MGCREGVEYDSLQPQTPKHKGVMGVTPPQYATRVSGFDVGMVRGIFPPCIFSYFDSAMFFSGPSSPIGLIFRSEFCIGCTGAWPTTTTTYCSATGAA